MLNQKRLRDYGVTIGGLEPGPKNAITDVEGVAVGHVTISDRCKQTGVTAILPHQGNVFKEKLIASCHIINGFGKTMGTLQLNELGTLETPIILTNTLSIGVAADACFDYTLERNPEIGRTTGTVNPVIGECNDMFLNDIRGKYVTREHVFQALEQASSTFSEGSVGAGRGMLCYSLKGGVGSSSRRFELEHGIYTIGVLVVSNFGLLGDLRINGNPIGATLKQALSNEIEEKDKGSIMIIVATDLPVSNRQINRLLKRSVTGLSRTGSMISNGSGDVVIGFSTATKIPHDKTKELLSIPAVHEGDLDIAFRAIGEATEEAILNALVTAERVVGRDGNERPALRDLIEHYHILLS
ncbi:P1 family peptidase [Pullulanibacillus sp. KACC 23026]|uniref:DmpA family aminopeptidase n=1 Tax=Pullulanibacillus sp. KACC 23026 TaxID=3028315 RepID=UPI0023B054B2|nr:P1 family peptidase [Pullulanibacillus sp. KACC 23026]WEG14725.1 P1 family peptidase [Pullulanibacillus sp. KACC 23026]